MTVGIVGLGAMGSAMAQRLISAGRTVCGFDPSPERANEFAEMGGARKASVTAVAAASEIILLSLPSEAAYRAVVAEIAGVGSGQTVLCTCTMALSEKQWAHNLLMDSGIVLLDCPVSGNRDSVLSGRLTLYGSGDESAYQAAGSVIELVAGASHYLGEFGTSTKFKLILNLLVTINNAATAEAMALATKADLDPALVAALVGQSFAASEVWRARAPMMVRREYRSARGTYGVARKDAALIDDLATKVLSPVPLFQAALQLHRVGQAAGFGESDTASLYEVYRLLGGMPR